MFFIVQGQNQSGGTGGRGDGKKDDKVINKIYFSQFWLAIFDASILNYFECISMALPLVYTLPLARVKSFVY